MNSTIRHQLTLAKKHWWKFLIPFIGAYITVTLTFLDYPGRVMTPWTYVYAAGVAIWLHSTLIAYLRYRSILAVIFCILILVVFAWNLHANLMSQ